MYSDSGFRERRWPYWDWYEQAYDRHCGRTSSVIAARLLP
jgi:hypothetical protein